MFRLSYFSKNLIRRSANPRQSELRKIIMSARANNRILGISGGLMFNRDYFGQVLEGDRSSVTMLFCRIANDPRHCSIELVEAGPIEHRMFDRWSMGLAERSETAEQINQKFGLVTGFNP